MAAGKRLRAVRDVRTAVLNACAATGAGFLTAVLLVAEIAIGETPRMIGWTSLAFAAGAIGLAAARTVRNAVRLGRAQDAPATQTQLARTIYRDHLNCLTAMVAVVVLQLGGIALRG